MPSGTFDYVDRPLGTDVIGYLGWVADAELLMLAEKHVQNVAMAARSYCRSRGWEKQEGAEGTVWRPAEDIAHVIITAAARSLSNPEGAREVSAGTFRSAPGSLWSWSLLERLVLDNYRLKAG